MIVSFKESVGPVPTLQEYVDYIKHHEPTLYDQLAIEAIHAYLTSRYLQQVIGIRFHNAYAEWQNEHLKKEQDAFTGFNSI